MHDPVGICAVLFREFGLYPFGDEVRQYLGFNGSTRFVCYVEWKELNGPFGNLARGIAVVYDVVEWYFESHHDRTLLEVVTELSGCHEDRICYLLVMRVPGFAWCEDSGYIVYQFLEWELVSVLLSLDDEDGTHHLVCCRYV